MRLYQIVMKVPDDFVPEEMQLTASSKSTVEICSEGFIGSCFNVVESCEEDVEIVDSTVVEETESEISSEITD